MLDIFDQALKNQVGFGIDGCGGTAGVYVYLDDAVFSGTRVRYDIENWLQQSPAASSLHVVVMAFHRGGQWYADSKMKAKASELGKSLEVNWWTCAEIEDRKRYVNQTDVLRPTALPDDEAVRDYAKQIEESGYPIPYRTGNQVGALQVFSSPNGRVLLEQEFLKAGVRIRAMCPHLPDTMRPLGYSRLSTLGFGTMFATHHNCPNNCPLALWVGDPWYPLLPRRTN